MKRKQKDTSSKILDNSKKYAKIVHEKSSPVQVKEVTSTNSESKKRKSTAADKERKRNKRKLKRLKELEKKQNQNNDGEKLKAKSLALSYLREWHTERSNWTFKKKRQHWLLSHIYSLEIPDEDFNILLDYIVSLQGVAKERLISDSEKVIQNYENKDSEAENEDAEDSLIQETENRIFERAKNVLQILV